MGLPRRYAGWVRDVVGGPLPRERRATCDDCVMLCKRRGRATRDAIWFDPTTKCCTYQPSLPNYLVGLILGNARAGATPGRATVEQRIARGVGVTPLGLEPPREFSREYAAVGADFGRRPDLRCPHYVSNGCSIWRYRPAVCATWFCKHERGAVGMRFWRPLERLLDTVQRNVAAHCVLELGMPPAALTRALTPNGGDAELWGPWRRRERELYQRCAEIAAGLGWSEVRALGGAELRLQERAVHEGYSALRSHHIPDRLVRTGWVSYGAYDPLIVPAAVLSALHRFDGRPNAEVLREIKMKDGLELGRSALRQLVDFELLAPAPGNS